LFYIAETKGCGLVLQKKRFTGLNMKVHLIRHAQAIERSTELPDEYRNLTCRGRKRFRQVAASLKKMGVDPDFIITSPKVRAVQTAEIFSETIQFSGEVQISAALAEGPDIAALGNMLRERKTAAEIVIVGHEPGLGDAIREMLKLPTRCQLSKGCVVSLQISIKQSGLTAELAGLITGGGKAIRKTGAAMERLLGNDHADMKEIIL
jgi:phosphohistidine phosphatase